MQEARAESRIKCLSNDTYYMSVTYTISEKLAKNGDNISSVKHIQGHQKT